MKPANPRARRNASPAGRRGGWNTGPVRGGRHGQADPLLGADLDALTILHYPDPRLRTPCAEVTIFDDRLAALSRRMLELMRASDGVGLAAPQVGLLLRLFVMQLPPPAGGDGKSRPPPLIFVNPVLRDLEGTVEGEEGCLSLPGVNVQIRRAVRCRIEAQDLSGAPLAMEGEGMICRVWQHETDHLNGILILDRMGPSDRIATRKTLKALEDTYRARSGNLRGP